MLEKQGGDGSVSVSLCCGEHLMEPQIALRVLRGPDWSYGDQDGGEGCLGTVVAINAGSEDNKVAVVFWDNGGRGEYRCGEDGKYDLRVLENSPTGEEP